MVDLKNRNYKSVAFFDEDMVCFEMENGLAYIVSLGSNEIDVRVYADSFLRFLDEVQPGDKIGRDELQKAVKILKTAPLPKYSKDDIADLDKAVRRKLSE